MEEKKKIKKFATPNDGSDLKRETPMQGIWRVRANSLGSGERVMLGEFSSRTQKILDDYWEKYTPDSQVDLKLDDP